MARQTGKPPRRTLARAGRRRAGTAERSSARPANLVAAVDAALQAYADRGVFRGYSATAERGGTRSYRFLWLTRKPVLLRLNAAAQSFAFVGIFPQVSTVDGLAAALRREMRLHTTARVPGHRRLDPLRATMDGRVARGNLTLRVRVLRGDVAAVVRAALVVVHDLFQFLHECYPDYLSVQFGTPDE